MYFQQLETLVNDSLCLIILFVLGASSTGAYSVMVLDSNGNTYQEFTSGVGFDIIAGSLSGVLRWTPVQRNPGISSDISLRFSTSAILEVSSKISIDLNTPDYAMSSSPTIVVTSPSGVSVSSAWSSDTLVVLLTAGEIQMDQDAVLIISDVEMPPHVVSEIQNTAILVTSTSTDLILDGPTFVTLDEVYAGTLTGSPIWSPSFPNPGISTDVTTTYVSAGKMPQNGIIRVSLPANEYSMQAIPSVTFVSPSTMTGIAAWNGGTNALEISISNELPGSSQVEFIVSTVDSPLSVRAEATNDASIEALDDSGNLIDGPTSIVLQQIVAGQVVGSRTWIPVTPNPGIQSNQDITFNVNGKLGTGSFIEFAMPDHGWAMVRTHLF